MPDFLRLVIGALLAEALQDFIILVASMRGNGSALLEIARDELGLVIDTATVILFIVIVALAGLGVAVVKALYFNAWGC